jgi:hypothetical protein
MLEVLDRIDLGVAALDLLRRLRAHENDESAAVNTLLAAFEMASPISRATQRYINFHLLYISWLRDIAEEGYGLSTPRLDLFAKQSTFDHRGRDDRICSSGYR